MRYFISILILAVVLLLWREVVTKNLSQSFDLGLCGIFAIGFVGLAIATAIAKLITGQDPTRPQAPSSPTNDNGSPQKPARAGSESAPVLATVPENAKRETHPVFDDSFTVPKADVFPTGAEWYVIHAGEERGPYSPGELVERAVAGKVAPDDLVKQTGGPWTKARDLAFLQEQFVSPASKKELARPNFLWVFQPPYAISACAVVFLVVIATVWFRSLTDDQRVDAERKVREAQSDADQRIEKARQAAQVLLADLNRREAELRQRELELKPNEDLAADRKKLDSGIKQLDAIQSALEKEWKLLEMAKNQLELDRKRILTQPLEKPKQVVNDKESVDAHNRDIFARVQKFVDAHPKIEDVEFRSLGNLTWESCTRPFRVKESLSKFEQERLLDFLGKAVKYAPHNSDPSFPAVIADLKQLDFRFSSR